MPGGASRSRPSCPVASPGPAGSCRHRILLDILARGILTRLVTRVYFEGEPSNGEDPVLTLVPGERRHTLLAIHEGGDRYRFDIVLQGDGETVFFDV